MAAPAVVAQARAGTADTASAQVWREALIAGVVTFLLTCVIVGFETVSSTASLQLRPRPGAVAFAVMAAALGAAAMGYLRLRRPIPPLVLSAAAALVMLVPLLADAGSRLATFLPFAAAELNWAALSIPAVVALRA